MKKVSISDGLFLGVFTSIPVIVITFLSKHLAGLSFPPMELYAFMSRVLPESVVSYGIDIITKIVTVFGLQNAFNVADLADLILSAIQFIVLGGVIGIVFALFGKRGQTLDVPSAGLGAGAFLFGFFTAIEYSLGFPPAGPLAGLAWLGVVLLGWNIILARMVREIIEELNLPVGRTAHPRSRYLRQTGIAAIIAVLIFFWFLIWNPAGSDIPVRSNPTSFSPVSAAQID